MIKEIIIMWRKYENENDGNEEERRRREEEKMTKYNDRRNDK